MSPERDPYHARRSVPPSSSQHSRNVRLEIEEGAADLEPHPGRLSAIEWVQDIYQICSMLVRELLLSGKEGISVAQLKVVTGVKIKSSIFTSQ